MSNRSGWAETRDGASLVAGRLPERTNGAASKAVVASGSPWVRIPYLPPFNAGLSGPALSRPRGQKAD